MKAILDVKLVNTVNVKEIKKIEDLISELCDCAICLVFFLTGNILLLIGRNNAVWFHYYTQHNFIFFDSNSYSECLLRNHFNFQRHELLKKINLLLKQQPDQTIFQPPDDKALKPYQTVVDEEAHILENKLKVEKRKLTHRNFLENFSENCIDENIPSQRIL